MFPFLLGLFGTGWFSDLLKRRDEYRFSMSYKYNDGQVSDWVVNQIKKSEGIENKAYKLPKEAQYTIGYGTSYLYKQDGSPFVTGYFKGVRKGGNGVRPADTLDRLKKAMGYGNLSNEAFATQLIINHIYAKGGAYDIISKHFDLMLVPFNQTLKDGLQEFAYGSQSYYNTTRRHGSLKRELGVKTPVETVKRWANLNENIFLDKKDFLLILNHYCKQRGGT